MKYVSIAFVCAGLLAQSTSPKSGAVKPFSQPTDAERVEMLNLFSESLAVYDRAYKATEAAKEMQARVKGRVDKLLADHGASSCSLNGLILIECKGSNQK